MLYPLKGVEHGMPMDFSRIMNVLVICVPVFAVLGLGKLLGIKGKIKEEFCVFINWLVYTFSLPALIFNEVARQRFDTFLDPAVVVMPLIALVIVIAVTMVIVKVNKFKDGFAAAFVYGTFWANATYIGLPLCQNAFGSEGLAKAAIYNGFVVPFFILFGYLLIGFYGAGTDRQTIGERIKKAFVNPVLLSAVGGIIVALTAEQFRHEDGSLNLPMPIISSAALVGSFLKMIGSMGLPLALLSIGASLKWEQTRSHLGALGWSVTCKLLLLPLVTFVLIRIFCPGADSTAIGVTTILSATPSAVAMYVISSQVGVERGFASSMLVISTALSVFTIPVWVYVISGF
jgi:predicted permease